MKTKIGLISNAIKSINGTKFVSLTYLSKSSNELARYTIILGFSYNTLVEKSVTDLEVILPTLQTDIEKLAGKEVMESLQKTLAAHKLGQQNEDYTKKEQYIPIDNGLNLNSTDNTLQLFGLVQSKVVLVEGEHKKVNSKPLTIEKNKIRKQLSMSKFREFALDVEQIGQVKINGNTIDFVPKSILSTLTNVEGDLTEHQPEDVNFIVNELVTQ